MSDAAFVEMVVVCSSAGGLILLAAAKVLFAARSAVVRLVSTVACVLAPGVALLTLDQPKSVPVASGVVALVAIAWAVLGCRNVSAGLAMIGRGLRRPAVPSAVLAVGSAVLMIAALGRFEAVFEDELDSDMAYMHEVTWKPRLHELPEIYAATDAGRPVTVWEPAEPRPQSEVATAERRVLTGMGFDERLIRVGPPAEGCNCHGWPFTGGRYWVGPDDVEHILEDNHYVAVSQPQVGDLAIYRDHIRITHTAVVKTAAAGGPILVESKWGWMGAFLHSPEGSCYGRGYTFYHAPREGHLLLGLGGHPRESSGPSVESTRTNAARMTEAGGPD
jgi:hypothetical protein